MKRFASVIDLLPDKKQAYLAFHQNVWPEVSEKIRQCNIVNYSIFLLGDRLFSYFEYVGTDFDQDMQRLNADPVNQRWVEQCMAFQQPLAERRPGEWWMTIPEVWHQD